MRAGQDASRLDVDELARKRRSEKETYEAFLKQPVRGREAQAQILVDEIVDIADDDKDDVGFKETENKDGQSAKPVILLDNVHRAKLRVDARKWVPKIQSDGQ
jgi:hypothetical protein